MWLPCCWNQQNKTNRNKMFKRIENVEFCFESNNFRCSCYLLWLWCARAMRHSSLKKGQIKVIKNRTSIIRFILIELNTIKWWLPQRLAVCMCILKMGHLFSGCYSIHTFGARIIRICNSIEINSLWRCRVAVVSVESTSWSEQIQLKPNELLYLNTHGMNVQNCMLAH